MPVSAELARDTTRLLVGMRQGDAGASQHLLELVYGQLRALAGSFFRNQPGDHTLQPTALVHEVWMRMADQSSLELRDRAHFFAVAATAMRQILIDHARRRGAEKRGGKVERVAIGTSFEPAAKGSTLADGRAAPATALDVLALDEALRRLAAIDPRQARVVELRFFGGLGMEEVAETLDVSKRTAELDWTMARAWLSRELAGNGRP
ncbi:MAG: sigma-70 family RNA polymerase sigma factor [Phycisphaerales bacterium]